MILDATTKTVTVVLEATATTNNCPITAAYEDLTTTTFTAGGSDTITNGTNAVTAVAAPGSSTQRRVREITIYNADTVAHTITVALLDNGTSRTIYVGTVAATGSIVYTNGVWSGVPRRLASESFDNTVPQIAGDYIQQFSLVNLAVQMRNALTLLAQALSLSVDPGTGRLRVLLENVTGSGAWTSSVVISQTSPAQLTPTISAISATGGGGNKPDTLIFDAMQNAWANSILPVIARS